MQPSEQRPSSPGPDLLRAARALLGWSLTRAGERASLSISAVVSAEGRSVRSCPALPSDVHKLRRAYEETGIRFLDEDAGGRGLLMDDP